MSKTADAVSQPAQLISNVQRRNGAMLIQTRPSKGPAWFLSLWLIGWTVGCVFLVVQLTFIWCPGSRLDTPPPQLLLQVV